MTLRKPDHDHLLRARPEGEVLRQIAKQSLRGRQADRNLINSTLQSGVVRDLDARVAEAERKFDEQKVQQRRYVVDANGFGTHLTIQEAVTEALGAATTADPTAVIYLNPDIYVENVVIDVTGTDLKAITFVAEGAHGSATDLVFPTEIEDAEEFVTSVIVRPDDTTTFTFEFKGTSTEAEIFATFFGMKIEGNFSITDDNAFTAKIRLIDTFVNYTGAVVVFDDTVGGSAVNADLLMLRSLVVAPAADLFGGVDEIRLFCSISRIELNKLVDAFTSSNSASAGDPFTGSVAALQTCHIVFNDTGFEGEWLFLLILSCTVMLPDTANGVQFLADVKVVGNLGLIGMVLVDDETSRSVALIEVDETQGLITACSFYGRNDIGSPSGDAIFIDDTSASTLNIVHNRIIGYNTGVRCNGINSLTSVSIIGPNSFIAVTIQYVEIFKSALHQWPVIKANLLVPSPVSILHSDSSGVPVVDNVRPTLTNAFVGLVHVESPIETDSLSYRHSSGGTANAVIRIAIYTDNGIKIVDVTDAVGAAAAGRLDVVVSPAVMMEPGNYYFFFCLASGSLAPFLHLYHTFNLFGAPSADQWDLEGNLTIIGGVAGPLVDFRIITTPTVDRTPVLRLDGVLS